MNRKLLIGIAVICLALAGGIFALGGSVHPPAQQAVHGTVAVQAAPAPMAVMPAEAMPPVPPPPVPLAAPVAPAAPAVQAAPAQ